MRKLRHVLWTIGCNCVCVRGLRHLLWLIVYNWVLRHPLWQIPEHFLLQVGKKSLSCILVLNTTYVSDPLARVDGSTPHPPRVYVRKRTIPLQNIDWYSAMEGSWAIYSTS